MNQTFRTIFVALIWACVIQVLLYIGLSSLDLSPNLYGIGSSTSFGRSHDVSRARLMKAFYRAQNAVAEVAIDEKTTINSTRKVYELFDPIVELDRNTGTKAEVESQDGRQILSMEGNFVPNQSGERVVLTADGRLQVFVYDNKFAEYTLGGTPERLEVGLFPVRKLEAVNLVRDGTLQILTHWREVGPEGSVSHRIGIFKIIGRRLAKIFDGEIAHQPSMFAPWEWRGIYQFLNGQQHAMIRWIDLDRNGAYSGQPTELYRWNHWEGVYRPPEWMPGGKLTKPRSKRWNPLPNDR